ncbi:MAG: NAD(P)-dependent oxidoreductase, partial [Burkholderiaceae bacterium]|nr:NAD(P)-dependent oxidoreductase [Burkholderiaceae bacterium]
MPKVVLMEDYADHARTLACVQDLARRADLTIVTRKAQSEDEVVERLRDAQIAITIRDRVMFTAGVLGRLPGLKLLSVCGPRLAPHVDLDAATRMGILVAAPRPADAPLTIHRATAEMAWALILGLFKGLVTHHNGMRAGAWQGGLGLGLAGKTLGIIGLGKIGSVAAQIGVAMGMRVLAWSPRLTVERARASGAEAVALDDLLGASDVISVHANVTPESVGLLGAGAFAKMRPGAFLVNTARAALIDEQA